MLCERGAAGAGQTVWMSAIFSRERLDQALFLESRQRSVERSGAESHSRETLDVKCDRIAVFGTLGQARQHEQAWICRSFSDRSHDVVVAHAGSLAGENAVALRSLLEHVSEPQRILMLGAGVIGSVYAGKLLEAGHHVVMLARGTRLTDLRTRGLALDDSGSKQHSEMPVSALAAPGADERYDLVVVAVRSEQLAATLPILTAMNDGSDVLFLGNTAGRTGELIDALGDRALFGFPAVGGIRDGAVVRYVLIRQQKTTLGECSGATSPRVRRLQAMLRDAGFPTAITANVEGWLLGHVAFVVPIAFALYRVDTDAARLAGDHGTLRLMVRATRQAFQALRAAGIAEIPTNLTVLYVRMPERFAVHYWRRILSGPRGELWFAAHSRAAVQEMTSLADELRAAVHGTGHDAPDLDALLSRR
jgi:2-dehydropantoate 2-reductase